MTIQRVPSQPTWWRSALVGAAVGAPATVAVVQLGGMFNGWFAGFFLVFAPFTVIPLVTVGSFIIWWTTPRWYGWHWVIAAPFAMWMVLGVGALASGPFMSSVEQTVGWALVTLVMYGAASVIFTSQISRRPRWLALAALVVAAPAMVVYDDLSQHRWGTAAYAATPPVLPVVPGYVVTAARPNGAELEVEMTGPSVVHVWVRRCVDCGVRREIGDASLTIVDGRYEIALESADGVRPATVPPDQVTLRPADAVEQARLPLAPAWGAD